MTRPVSAWCFGSHLFRDHHCSLALAPRAFCTDVAASLLGCVVGLLPFFGFWPPYFVRGAFLLLFLGVHLAAVAIAGGAWLIVMLLATRLGLTNR